MLRKLRPGIQRLDSHVRIGGMEQLGQPGRRILPAALDRRERSRRDCEAKTTHEMAPQLPAPPDWVLTALFASKQASPAK